MRRARVALVLVLGAWLSWTAAGAQVPVARAADATTLFVHCCPDGFVGQPIIANIQPADDNGKNDGNFTGTITFSTDFTNKFTVTPHDPGQPHQYTFKPGDLVDGGTNGKNFKLVFNEPGTGQLFVTSPGLETIYDNPDSPSGHSRNNDFTIRPRQAGSTTTTTTGGGGTTTTTTGGGGGTTTTTTGGGGGTTTTTTGGGGGTTTTTTGGGGGTSTTVPGGGGGTTSTTAAPRPGTTTTTPIRVAGPTTTRQRIAATGAPVSDQTRVATALLLFGAFLLIVASVRRWHAPRIASSEASYSDGLYRAIRDLHDRIS